MTSGMVGGFGLEFSTARRVAEREGKFNGADEGDGETSNAPSSAKRPGLPLSIRAYRTPLSHLIRFGATLREQIKFSLSKSDSSS
jgi:hypothetical protein